MEAYIGQDDLASHARFGLTQRNRVMFGPAGQAYVYLVYGMYHCLNVVTEPPGRPAAILVRAVEPIEGIELMRAGRLARAIATRKDPPPDWHAAEAKRIAGLPTPRLASGPGLVGAAFGIERSATGLDLCDPASPLRLEPPPSDEEALTTPLRTATSPRIGVDYAGPPWTSHPWRFFLPDSPSVSGPRKAG